jgi:hypothetical protein
MAGRGRAEEKSGAAKARKLKGFGKNITDGRRLMNEATEKPEIQDPIEIDIADYLRRSASLMAAFAARLERMEAKVGQHVQELGAAAGMMATVDQMAADVLAMKTKLEYLAAPARLRRLPPNPSVN